MDFYYCAGINSQSFAGAGGSGYRHCGSGRECNTHVAGAGGNDQKFSGSGMKKTSGLYSTASLTTDVVPLSCVDYETVAECLEVLGPLSEERKMSATKVIPIIRIILNKITEKSLSLVHPCAQVLSHFLMKMATVLGQKF